MHHKHRFNDDHESAISQIGAIWTPQLDGAPSTSSASQMIVLTEALALLDAIEALVTTPPLPKGAPASDKSTGPAHVAAHTACQDSTVSTSPSRLPLDVDSLLSHSSTAPSGRLTPPQPAADADPARAICSSISGCARIPISGPACQPPLLTTDAGPHGSCRGGSVDAMIQGSMPADTDGDRTRTLTAPVTLLERNESLRLSSPFIGGPSSPPVQPARPYARAPPPMLTTSASARHADSFTDVGSAVHNAPGSRNLLHMTSKFGKSFLPRSPTVVRSTVDSKGHIHIANTRSVEMDPDPLLAPWEEADTNAQPEGLGGNLGLKLWTGNKSKAEVPRLGVRLLQARGLPHTAAETSLDLFASVKCERRTFKTQAEAKTGEPTWDEFFVYEVHHPANAVLRVRIFDRMRCWRPKLLGEVRIPIKSISDLRTKYAAPTWHPLRSRKGTASPGQVQLQLYYLSMRVHRALNVMCCTWNVGNEAPPESLSAWLRGVDKLEHDIVAIGVQECSYRVKDAVVSKASLEMEMDPRLQGSNEEAEDDSLSTCTGTLCAPSREASFRAPSITSKSSSRFMPTPTDSPTASAALDHDMLQDYSPRSAPGSPHRPARSPLATRTVATVNAPPVSGQPTANDLAQSRDAVTQPHSPTASAMVGLLSHLPHGRRASAGPLADGSLPGRGNLVANRDLHIMIDQGVDISPEEAGMSPQPQAVLSEQSMHNMFAAGIRTQTKRTVDHDHGNRGNMRDVWEDTLKDAMGPHYWMVRSVHMGQMRLVVFARNDVVSGVGEVARGSQATGVAGVATNKGGVAIALKVWDTDLCFVNCHLAAHQDKCMARNSNYRDIVRGIRLDDQQMDVLTAYHHVFWMGDLNYRLEYGSQAGNPTESPLPADFQALVSDIDEQKWPQLLGMCQLRREMQLKRAFLGFNEPEINFAPTFKVERSKGLHYKMQRSPAWCDRVLYRSNLPLKQIRPIDYFAAHDISTSDHKPVGATFTVPTVWRQDDEHEQPITLVFTRLAARGLFMLRQRRASSSNTMMNPESKMPNPKIILMGPCLQDASGWESHSVKHCREPVWVGAPPGALTPRRPGATHASTPAAQAPLPKLFCLRLNVKRAPLQDLANRRIMVRIVDAGDGHVVSGRSTLARGVLCLTAPAMQLLQSNGPASLKSCPVTVNLEYNGLPAGTLHAEMALHVEGSAQSSALPTGLLGRMSQRFKV